MLIDNATKGTTETILFNIDIEGSINKDKTAVLRVFAKMFYNHLGFFVENLKVALLEQYIEREGKTEAFRKAFEAKKGKPWLEQRKAFAFNGNAVVPALMEALGMSEEDAQSWFKDISMSLIVSLCLERISNMLSIISSLTFISNILFTSYNFFDFTLDNYYIGIISLLVFASP